MKYRDDLKIELRAVPYASYSHALEYRISPDQDLRYLEDDDEKSWFGFIMKLVHKNKKYDTSWHQPRIFSYPVTMELHEFDNEFNWGPILCNSAKSLKNFKEQFKTYGDIRKFIKEHTEKSYEKWKSAREDYLDRMKPIY